MPKKFGYVDPAGKIFKGCRTTGERLKVLAECYADAFIWRQEEAKRMSEYEKRLKKLEVSRGQK